MTNMMTRSSKPEAQKITPKTSITVLPPKWVTASCKLNLTFRSVNETFLTALWHCAMVLFASQRFTMSLLWFKSPSLQIYKVDDYLCVIYQQIDTLAALRMILHLFMGNHKSQTTNQSYIDFLLHVTSIHYPAKKLWVMIAKMKLLWSFIKFSQLIL